MAATIQIFNRECRVSSGTWESPADPAFADQLNEWERWNREQFSGYDPERDYTSAMLMVKRFGGRIVSYDPPPPLPEGEDIAFGPP